MWIVHYQDGTTKTENKGIDWADPSVSKANITAIDIKANDGKIHTLSKTVATVGWFQHKEGVYRSDGKGNTFLAQEVGRIEKDGRATIVRVDMRTNQSKTYEANVFDLKMNLDLHGLKEQDGPDGKEVALNGGV